MLPLSTIVKKSRKSRVLDMDVIYIWYKSLVSATCNLDLVLCLSNTFSLLYMHFKAAVRSGHMFVCAFVSLSM